MNLFLPQILSMPPIPKGLQGVTPRNIQGVDWWIKTKNKTIEKHGLFCAVSGIECEYNELHCHEIYIYDYEAAIASYLGTCMIQKDLHAYFHFGRVIRKSIDENTKWLKSNVIETYELGDYIINKNNLKPHYLRVLMYSKYLAFYNISCSTLYYDYAQSLKPLKSVECINWKLSFSGFLYNSSDLYFQKFQTY